MDGKYFKPVLEPSSSPFMTLFDNSGSLYVFLKDSFKFHTLLAIGAAIQILICLVFPLRWAILPVCALLLNALITTIVQITRPRNDFNKHVIPGRVTAILPSPSTTGRHGPKPSSEPLLVFHLGVTTNHPLGILSSGWKEVGQYFADIIAELNEHKEEYGFISRQSFKASERSSHNLSLLTFYFRDLEGLHKFAQGDVHRRAWDGYNKGRSWQKNIGIYHETYMVQPGGYETLYRNAVPTLLGRGMVKVPSNAGEKYMNTLVKADIPALKTSLARLGRDENGRLKENDG